MSAPAALVALALALAAATDDGTTAFREGRYAEALPLLEAQVAAAPTYEAWLTLGLTRGRLEQLGPARVALDRAIALDPRRPEAWIERGGLSFLERRYAAAVPDLEAGLRRGPADGYARDLLATSLHLAGRSDEALAHWNALGQPQLRTLELVGLRHTRDRLVRRELQLREGELLRLADLRASRLRLAELGVFERATLRPVPRGRGIADLQAAFVERHGFFSSPFEFALGLGVQAAQGRVRLRYANAAGLGLNLGGEYRFQENRPELALFGELPRPFGLPATMRLRGFRGRQGYEAAGEFQRRSRGLELALRHVQGSRTVLELGFDAQDRHFDRSRVDLLGGWLVGPRGAVEIRLVDRHRQRLDARAELGAPLRAFGSTTDALRAEVHATYKLHLSLPEGAVVERSQLALRVKAGWATDGLPLDERFVVGASPEMDWPVRARRMYSHGRLGTSTPLARRVALSNLEWRRRLFKGTALQAGAVVFHDAAWLGDRTGTTGGEFQDAGLGLRFGFRGGTVLRFDWGHGLLDGRDAFSFGLGYFF